MRDNLLSEIAKLIEEAAKADACSGCAFFEADEWEMPCCKCKRNSKDYWRPSGGDAK